MHDGQPQPLTVRLLGKERDVHLDLAGGNRIPRISERRARTVGELRAAGIGVDRVLLIHDDTPECSDLFQAVLTMLDPKVSLGVATFDGHPDEQNGHGTLSHDLEQAGQLGRRIEMHELPKQDAEAEIVRLARAGKYDLLVLSLQTAPVNGEKSPLNAQALLRQTPCRVFLSAPQPIPQEPEA
jgi:hypothetical protein